MSASPSQDREPAPASTRTIPAPAQDMPNAVGQGTPPQGQMEATEPSFSLAAQGCVNALVQVRTMIDTINSALRDIELGERSGEDADRLIYIRNTLTVALDTWHSDIMRRVHRSGQAYTIYCMTEAEKKPFYKSVARGLVFAVREMEQLDTIRKSHQGYILDKILDTLSTYARDNKALVKSLIDMEEDVAAITVPDIPTYRAEYVQKTATTGRP